MSKTGTKQAKPGRPPAGRDGAAVRDYPRVAVRLPPAVAARLRAWSDVSRVPQWALIAQAVEAALNGLAAEDAELVRKLAKRHIERYRELQTHHP